MLIFGGELGEFVRHLIMLVLTLVSLFASPALLAFLGFGLGSAG